MSQPASYLPQGFTVPIDLDLSKNEGSTRAGELLASITEPGAGGEQLPGHEPPSGRRWPDSTGCPKTRSWSPPAGMTLCCVASWHGSALGDRWCPPIPHSR